MQDSFDAFRFVEFLKARWTFVAVTCAVAVILALVLSLLAPRKYTATATIVIEPPAANDSRAATAVSPVYLESLKSYEQFASSDSLFLRALERFQVRPEGSSVESLKRQVLKVTKLRDTKILQISATLPDAKHAHEFAQYLAEETVALSRGVSHDADQAMIASAEQQLDSARAALAVTQGEWERYRAAQPVEGLQADVDAMVEVKASTEKQLLEAKTNEAEYASRVRTPGTPSNRPDAAGEMEFVEKQLGAERARVAVLDRQVKDLVVELERRRAELAHREARYNQLESELRIKQTAFDAGAIRLRDVRASTGSRGENLQIIDPSIVPQRPSSPNIALNLAAALLAAVVVSILYLSLLFGYNTKKAEDMRASYRAARVED